jgi:signal transduction histidine kinase
MKQTERRIASLNELFRLDALMAAETGDTGWTRSYVNHKLEFDRLSKIIQNTEPEINIAGLTEVRYQFKIETDALAYVQRGQLDEARSLLYDKGYQQINNIVTQKLLKLQQQFEEKDENYNRISERSNRDRLHIFWAIIIVISLIWILTFLLLSRYNTALEKYACEQEEQNESLSKLNKELDQLVYSMSHQTAGPIKSLLGLINLYRSDHDQMPLDDFLKMQHKVVRKLDAQITGVIYYSENLRAPLKISEFDLPTLIEDEIIEFKGKSICKGAEITFTPGECKTIRTDRMRLKAVIDCLLNNAVLYHEKEQQHKKVNISCDCDEEGFYVAIEDNGIGIAPENQERIFDMFEKLNHISSGPGLGLYNVKEILNRLKGDISVDSEVGKGSVFKVMVRNAER